MELSMKSHIGLKRSINQDAYGSKILSDSFAWAVVCDGMGGMAAGNIASEIAVRQIEKSFDDNLAPKLNKKQITNLLKSTVESANAAIYAEAASNEEYKGMGTTVVCAVLKDEDCYIAHAGDSRLYLLRDGKLEQITIDHSIVQSMVDKGHLTEDEARSHPNKNIITRALGVHSDVDVDITEITVKGGDILLLCTDGLNNCVEDKEITEILAKTEFSDIADKLVEKANDGGGNDNITVVALKL